LNPAHSRRSSPDHPGRPVRRARPRPLHNR
jgi:hypothetical protein